MIDDYSKSGELRYEGVDAGAIDLPILALPDGQFYAHARQLADNEEANNWSVELFVGGEEQLVSLDGDERRGVENRSGLHSPDPADSPSPCGSMGQRKRFRPERMTSMISSRLGVGPRPCAASASA